MDTPAERAIAAFERLHRLTVTIHDLRGDLWHLVRPERLFHRHPLCQAMKHGPAEHRCIAFDVEALRVRLASSAGGYHVCHAGLLEWAVPVRSRQGLDRVLFAGPRRAGPALSGAWRDPQPATRGIWSEGSERAAGARLPAVVETAEAEDLLEALRALSARLGELCAVPRPVPAGGASGVRDEDANRTARIARFVAEHHVRPVRLADLAEELGVSPGRAGREVRRLLGAGFPALLAEARLVAAAQLLRTTAKPVLEVALATGFNDLSHFHACFRRRFSVTPAAWRLADRAV